MSDVMLVGGTFDSAQGEESSIVDELAGDSWTVYNGGYWGNLVKRILPRVENHDVVIWMPDVPNHHKNLVNTIKENHPTTTLISSKNLTDRDLTHRDLIQRMLSTRSAMMVTVDTEEYPYEFQILDPLNNRWYKGTDLAEFKAELWHHVGRLKNIERVRSKQLSSTKKLPDDENPFFDIVQGLARIFHPLVHNVANPDRMLGNASFRCSHGFPSMRSMDNSEVYVTQRNIDKRDIGPEDFVPVQLLDNGNTGYYGEDKPSVDTPIQLRLYRELEHVNYIVHGHVYIPGAPFTAGHAPCGGLEEVRLVLEAYDRDIGAVNLLGHGCLILAEELEDLVKYGFKARPELEDLGGNVNGGQ